MRLRITYRLQSKQLDAVDASWVSGHAPCAGRYSAKTRYRQADAACELIPVEDGFQLRFDEAQWAATPGQAAVLYQHDVCLGGATIAEVQTLRSAYPKSPALAV